jgi:hypothetical protein
MAVKTKRTQLGNYITKSNGFDIRMKLTYKKGTEYSKKPQVASHEYVVCKGKKLVKNGFKTKDEAIEYTNSQK